VIRCTSVPGYRLEGGAKTDEQLLRESLDAKVFIALLSKQSLESTYVLFELGARWGADKNLVPLVVASMTASELKPPLSGRNAHSAEVEDHLFQLVDEVATKLGLRLEKTPVYSAHVKRLVQVSKQGASKRPHAPAPKTSPQQNLRFVGAKAITAHAGTNGGAEIYESPQGLGDFQISILCFRNEAVVGQSIQEPHVNAHIVYKDKDGQEITDAPRGVWLEQYRDETIFEAGKKRCLVIFLLSSQDTLKKLWKETYTTETSWMAGGPLFRIRDEGISGDIASIEVSLLVDDACVLQAIFEVKPRQSGRLPELLLRSITPD